MAGDFKSFVASAVGLEEGPHGHGVLFERKRFHGIMRMLKLVLIQVGILCQQRPWCVSEHSRHAAAPGSAGGKT